MSDTVNIGGKHFEVKPLNLRSLKVLAEKGYLAKLSTVGSNNSLDAEQIDSVIQTIAIALQRNYPDVNATWIEENVEVQDIGDILNTILSVSGFRGDSSKRESP